MNDDKPQDAITDEPSPGAKLAATIGLAAETLRTNEAVSRDFANLSRTMSGTFEGPAGLEAFMPDTPPRHDIVVTPKPEDRKPCPHCRRLADEIRYEGAIVDATPGESRFRVHVSQAAEAQFLPCGHRFDGSTGELIPPESED